MHTLLENYNSVKELTIGTTNLKLRKIPLFHLISWCGNFVEMHSFETAFPLNLYTTKLGEITVFYVV